MLEEVAAGAHSLSVRIGVPGDDPSDGIAFGMGAEVNVLSFGFDLPGRDPARAVVAQGAIGSHDPATGRKRAAAYLRACEIAEAVNAALDAGETDLVALGASIEAGTLG